MAILALLCCKNNTLNNLETNLILFQLYLNDLLAKAGTSRRIYLCANRTGQWTITCQCCSLQCCAYKVTQWRTHLAGCKLIGGSRFSSTRRSPLLQTPSHNIAMLKGPVFKFLIGSPTSNGTTSLSGTLLWCAPYYSWAYQMECLRRSDCNTKTLAKMVHPMPHKQRICLHLTQWQDCMSDAQRYSWRAKSTLIFITGRILDILPANDVQRYNYCQFAMLNLLQMVSKSDNKPQM
jgi:hypothetical protein